MAEVKKKSSVEQRFFISPLQPQNEEELDRIRTEGDLTLIKVQTEKKKLAELEAKLAKINKQLRDRKQTPKPVKQGTEAKTTGKNKGILAALVISSTTGKGVAKKPLPTIPQSEEVEAKRAPSTCTTAATGRQLHTEERLKVAVAERTVELHKLRLVIDETRRKRLDALAREKELLKVIQEDEEDIKQAQEEIAHLKRQSTEMKNEITASEQEFDTEKHAFRLEQQRLLLELEELDKAEKQGDKEQTSTPVSHKYSMFYNNIAHRRKQQVRASKWKRVNLEQKIVSFEQKKRLLDRIIEESNVENLREFIQKYNEQEQTKAEVFARIEAQTATNAALNESIAQLTEDITRLSGAGDGDPNGDTEKPSAELQKVLDTDDGHIKRWVKDADIFAEAVKFLRDPIHDIYKDFFPNNHSEEVFDNAAGRESGMMRRIGAIEERVMQFIMAKILEETETSSAPNNSDTLRRLRQYQGRKEQRDFITPTLSIVPPSTIKRESGQYAKDGKTEAEEEDPEDPARDVAVIHSDVFRQRFNASTTESSTGNTTNAACSPTRKNANTALNLG